MLCAIIKEMENIIHTIDNWSIIKILGGFTVILSGIIYFFTNVLKTKIENSINYTYDSKLQESKSKFDNFNNLVNSSVQNHFLSSQKIFEKKTISYELIWGKVLHLKSIIPSSIILFHQIYTDEEHTNAEFINKLYKSKYGDLIKSVNINDIFSKIINNDDEINIHKPFISDETYKLFHTYRTLIGRVSHKLIDEFDYKKSYLWKEDLHLKNILLLVLTNEELNYVYGLNNNSLPTLIDLIEYKILQDIRLNLNIQDKPEDTIKYVKNIEILLKK